MVAMQNSMDIMSICIKNLEEMMKKATTVKTKYVGEEMDTGVRYVEKDTNRMMVIDYNGHTYIRTVTNSIKYSCFGI